MYIYAYAFLHWNYFLIVTNMNKLNNMDILKYTHAQEGKPNLFQKFS